MSIAISMTPKRKKVKKTTKIWPIRNTTIGPNIKSLDLKPVIGFVTKAVNFILVQLINQACNF